MIIFCVELARVSNNTDMAQFGFRTVLPVEYTEGCVEN
jgi:hypothetical protein